MLPPRRVSLALGLAMLAAALGPVACGHAGAIPVGRAESPAEGARVAPAQPNFGSPYGYEWFVRAELLAARAQYANAAEAYRRALASGDEDPYLLARLAEALDRAGDVQGAERALQAGLELDPYSEAVWLERGRSARQRGAIDQALAAYERAESAAPSSPDAPFAQAELLGQQGHPERALAVLERFAARNDAGSMAALRARLELARARGNGAALAEAARAWLAGPGGDAKLLRRTAAELLVAGRPALALRVLEGIAPVEQDAPLRLQTRLALMQREQVELLLATTPPEALGGPLEIADAYLRIDRPERALAALEEQASASDDEPHRRGLLRGLALLGTHQPASAALLLARIPAASAYHARAVQGLQQVFEATGLEALGREVGATIGHGTPCE
jgi:tetratricopeptide (TPR) repeat protein